MSNISNLQSRELGLTTTPVVMGDKAIDEAVLECAGHQVPVGSAFYREQAHD